MLRYFDLVLSVVSCRWRRLVNAFDTLIRRNESMSKIFPDNHHRGIHMKPLLWRGPATVLSDHLRSHGVDIKALGMKKEDFGTGSDSKTTVTITVRSKSSG